MEELIRTIKLNCGRDTWRDQGGVTSSITAFDGRLYVTTNVAVHEQIEYLLKLMAARRGRIWRGPRQEFNRRGR